jgi:hypothetical protein
MAAAAHPVAQVEQEPQDKDTQVVMVPVTWV